MAETICRRLRLANTVVMSQFVGEDNEVSTDTDKKVVVTHDGVTPGGIPGAREDLKTTPKSAITDKGIMSTNFENADFSVLDSKYAKVDGSNIKYNALFDEGVAKADATNIRLANTLQVGVARFATTSEAIAGVAADIMISPSTLKSAVASATRIFSPMYISGLDLYYSSYNTVIISKGYCRTSNDVANFNIDVDITLTLQSIQANTTYHAFIAQNASGQTVAQFTTDLVPNALINAGYVNYRRVGSVLTNSSSQIIPFTKIGPLFKYNTPITCTTTTLPIPKNIPLEVQTSTGYFHALNSRTGTTSISVEGYCDRREYA